MVEAAEAEFAYDVLVSNEMTPMTASTDPSPINLVKKTLN